MYSFTRGLSLTAHKAAADDIKPSITIGFLFLAADKNSPHMPAISNPPTLEITSTGSSLLGLFTSRALLIAFFLKLYCSSVSPAPLPLVISGPNSLKTLRTAAEVVVLPMPNSPVPNISYPSLYNYLRFLYPLIALMPHRRSYLAL